MFQSSANISILAININEDETVKKCQKAKIPASLNVLYLSHSTFNKKKIKIKSNSTLCWIEKIILY
jgi:hypothetical protein